MSRKRSDEVHVVEAPSSIILATNQAVVTTRKEALKTDITAVVEALRQGGKVAFWGPGNDHPQRVIADITRYPLMHAVLRRKVQMMVSGEIRYGKIRVDETTGFERLIPQRSKAIDRFIRQSNINLFMREAARDWYTFANVFVEFVMGKGLDQVVRIGCHDASHVRLATMDDRGNTNHAYATDWGGGKTDADAVKLPLLDPYGGLIADQLRGKPRAIYPVRELGLGQFYYGVTPWDGLRANGSMDVAVRIPELKKLLLEQLMHVRLHIEIDERYWPNKFKDWKDKSEAQRIDLMKVEVTEMNKWLKKDGQGGAFMSTMLKAASGPEQLSLVKVHEKLLTTPEGAYIEDWQEVDFITCRDMGLKPSLMGISASKSGSSPGSGSEDRVARTNHMLDNRMDQDFMVESMNVVRDTNGWDEDLVFWMPGYYAATLDRTNQVDSKPNASPER